MFGSPKNVCGVEIGPKAYDILKTLAAQPAAVKVMQLGPIMQSKYSDMTLYRVLTDLNARKLVILDPRVEEVRGFKFNQKYWSVTDDVKAHFTQRQAA